MVTSNSQYTFKSSTLKQWEAKLYMQYDPTTILKNAKLYTENTLIILKHSPIFTFLGFKIL